MIRAAEAPSPAPSERTRALLAWYAKARRRLPWRGVTDPYRVLVSEVMLQQTQAQRVIPHYERFVRRFPTIDDLATAPLSAVLAAWVGLGYNNRARRLQQTAVQITRHGWPADVAGLMELPGVGPYTARAVAAFGLGRDAVPVDTNVRRVVSRWRGEPLSGNALQLAAEEEAGGAVVSDWSQAVMDLGASLCRTSNPRCAECPVAGWCTGPETYQPPRPQAHFEGSTRQLRGRLVRLLVAGPMSFTELAAHSGFAGPDVAAALEQLTVEGMVSNSSGDGYRLPD